MRDALKAWLDDLQRRPPQAWSAEAAASGLPVPVEKLAADFAAFCRATTPEPQTWILLDVDLPAGTDLWLGDYRLKTASSDELIALMPLPSPPGRRNEKRSEERRCRAVRRERYDARFVAAQRGGSVQTKSLEDLRAADERTLHFTPYGLGGAMRPEDALAFQQRVIERYELAPEVAHGTRQRFEQLRSVYAYGLLCYDLFTVVRDAALLVVEQALRDRFVDFHDGTVCFRDGTGTEHNVAISGYADFYEKYKQLGGRRIPMGPSRRFTGFNGTLDGLYRWARREGLLRGQRNRGREKTKARMRNHVAHPSGYHLFTPVEASQALGDLAEIINHLWGHTTPGGRLYPAPVPHSIVAIGWRAASGQTMVCRAENLAVSSEDAFEYVLVRAVFSPGEAEDPNLMEFDSRFETTAYPADLLWGPGTRAEALAWLTENNPASSTCDYLDRVFLIRHHDGHLSLPMRPAIAAGLPTHRRTGTWYAVRADDPREAFAHIRQQLDASAQHTPAGECRGCSAETLARGDHRQALAAAEQAGASVAPVDPADVKAPTAFPRIVRTEP